MKLTSIFSASMLALGLATSAQANLVANGGFEAQQGCEAPVSWIGTGAFVNTNADMCGLSVTVPGAHSGDQYAGFGAVGGLGFISQNVATVTGQAYTFSFWLAGDLGVPNQFTASLDGIEVFNQTNIAGNSYALHSFNFVAADTLTTITFGGRNDPTWLHLDDVSFDVANTVPEPGSLGLLGLALTGLAALRRRKSV